MPDAGGGTCTKPVRGGSFTRMQTPDFPDDDGLQVHWAPDGAAVLVFADDNGDLIKAHLYEDGTIKTEVLPRPQ